MGAPLIYKRTDEHAASDLLRPSGTWVPTEGSGHEQTSVHMAAKSQKRRPSQRRSSRRRGAETMVFTRKNYLLLCLGVALVVVGYTAMRLENEVDGFISLYVAPLLILGGYLEVIWAILWRPRQPKPDTASESQG